QNLLPAHVFSNSRLSQSLRPKDSEPHHVPVCVFFAWAVIMQSFPYWSINVSLDLIEIALSRLTDFAEFERLATEVMYLDGWHDIKPLGGVSDQGQDAISESFFQAELERTVFQYTLQEYLPGKVAETIEKLKTNGIAFSELVIVTRHEISSESQLKMKRDARSDHNVRLEIYERKT